ncbi:MAG: hypothetical protein ONB46_10405 [candidate division KSB1 bacterium]|nr:hypothetical protein [candidate division KSB1 bacterium]MDZ7366216.1 hypothetical protein [candidate division KSB1 bacterium]MDZ7404434.1 hypothetical protein [candidate division KSB1 bacterium]
MNFHSLKKSVRSVLSAASAFKSFCFCTGLNTNDAPAKIKDERLDRGYNAFAECRKNIHRPPDEYLKEFYYDTVNFEVNAMQLAIAFAGTDHLPAGSDYPHQIGSLEKMLESIEALNLAPAAAKANTYAVRLLGL